MKKYNSRFWTCTSLTYLFTSAGCLTAQDPVAPSTDETEDNLMGSSSYDLSCHPADRVPIDVGIAYGRIASNSTAFVECMQTAMTVNTNAGLPGVSIGPYRRCDVDPSPTSANTILNKVWAPVDMAISCNYDFSGSWGGYTSIIGNAIGSGIETFTLENVLQPLSPETNCNYNPDGKPCIDDSSYTRVAYTVWHEAMHAEGYQHFEYPAQNCGIPQSENPAYANGVPYIVQGCIGAVLTRSQTSCNMHEFCGAGLKLVDSVYGSAPTCHCVGDPKPGAPIPPRAPTGCLATVHCNSYITWHCDANDNPLHIQSRPQLDATVGWTEGATLDDIPRNYRVCATSWYGEACGPVPFTTADMSGCGGPVCPSDKKWCNGSCIPRTAPCSFPE